MNRLLPKVLFRNYDPGISNAFADSRSAKWELVEGSVKLKYDYVWRSQLYTGRGVKQEWCFPFRAGPNQITLTKDGERYFINGLRNWGEGVVEGLKQIDAYLLSKEVVLELSTCTIKYGFRSVASDPDNAWIKETLLTGGLDVETGKWAYAEEVAKALAPSLKREVL